MTNPWGANNLDEFLFYCCPECGEQYKDCEQFVDHAFAIHESAKEKTVPDPPKITGDIEEPLHDISNDPLTLSTEVKQELCDDRLDVDVKEEPIEIEEEESNGKEHEGESVASIDREPTSETEFTAQFNKSENLSDGKIPCEYCDFKASRKQNMEIHLKFKHPGMKLKPEIAMKFEAIPSSLKKLFQCEHCEMKVCTKANLWTHVKHNHPEIKLKEYKKQPKKKKAKEPTLDRPFQCDHCEFSATTRYNLWTHIKHNHPDIELEEYKKGPRMRKGPFPCDYCDVKASDRYNLKQHMKRIHPEIALKLVSVVDDDK